MFFPNFPAFSKLEEPYTFRRAVQEEGSPGAERAPRATPERPSALPTGRAAGAGHARRPAASHPRFATPMGQNPQSENGGHFKESETIPASLPSYQLPPPPQCSAHRRFLSLPLWGCSVPSLLLLVPPPCTLCVPPGLGPARHCLLSDTRVSTALELQVTCSFS